MIKINESIVTLPDVKEIAKVAGNLKRFSINPMTGFKKEKFNPKEFLAHWQQMGYNDTRDVSKLLKSKYKFSDNEIKRIFSEVFGTRSSSSEYQSPVASESIMKLADYIKQNDLKDDIVSFLLDEFGDELGVKKEKKGFLSQFMKESSNIDRQEDIERFGRARR